MAQAVYKALVRGEGCAPLHLEEPWQQNCTDQLSEQKKTAHAIKTDIYILLFAANLLRAAIRAVSGH